MAIDGLLVAASVQGFEFDSAVIAKALAMDATEIEERLGVLERVHFLVRASGEAELPDRTLTLRYRFVHNLYQNALYALLGPARRAALSLAVAQALSDYHWKQSTQVASQLALLFDTARDFSRASHYFQVAGQNAARVFAHQEAVTLARRGLELLMTQTDSPERARQELTLQLTKAMSLSIVSGFASPEVEETYNRAWLLRRIWKRSKLYAVQNKAGTFRPLALYPLPLLPHLRDRRLCAFSGNLDTLIRP
jgi:predicted ATPase